MFVCVYVKMKAKEKRMEKRLIDRQSERRKEREGYRENRVNLVKCYLRCNNEHRKSAQANTLPVSLRIRARRERETEKGIRCNPITSILISAFFATLSAALFERHVNVAL